MPAVESIASQVAHIRAGLARASRETTAADEAAKRIAARSAGTGFVGVARSMSGLRQVITDIYGGLAAAQGSATSASAAVAVVAEASAPQETLAALTVLEQALETLHGQIGAVLQLITRARQTVIAVLAGGRPAVMLAAFDDIRRTLLTVAKLVNRARDEVKVAAAEARLIGEHAAGGSLEPPADADVVRQIESRTLLPVGSEWARLKAVDVPPHVRHAAKTFGPRFDGDQHKTTATYKERMLSSNDRRPELATDLAYEQLRRPNGKAYPSAPDLLYRHPEMQVAAEMREHRLSEAEVVVDNSMCGTREFDKNRSLTCRALLPDAMPAGSRLTVWVTVDAGRSFYRAVFTGTGTLIRP